MRSGSLVFETSILIVANPGELIDKVPYACVLNTVKFPASSVAVRMELPFDANSTEALGIAAPAESETLPVILVICCCARVVTKAIRMQHEATAHPCRLLVHQRLGPVLFLTVGSRLCSGRLLSNVLKQR